MARRSDPAPRAAGVDRSSLSSRCSENPLRPEHGRCGKVARDSAILATAMTREGTWAQLHVALASPGQVCRPARRMMLRRRRKSRTITTPRCTRVRVPSQRSRTPHSVPRTVEALNWPRVRNRPRALALSRPSTLLLSRGSVRPPGPAADRAGAARVDDPQLGQAALRAVLQDAEDPRLEVAGLDLARRSRRAGQPRHPCGRIDDAAHRNLSCLRQGNKALTPLGGGCPRG